VEELVQL